MSQTTAQRKDAGAKRVVKPQPHTDGFGDKRKVMRRYSFKLYPNKAQEAALTRQAELLAMLWNAALEQRETQWAQECQRRGKGERKGLSRFDQQRELKIVRAQDPEFAAMSSASLELCVKALDEAFSAFFRRAKSGAGASSGYPQYKSAYAIGNKGADCTIWHRDGTGWKLEPFNQNFRIYAKGVPGKLKARGKFPAALEEMEVRDMRIIRRSGVWHASVVVRLEARRAPGPHKLQVELDLLDEFASVKSGANGVCAPGWEEDFQSSDERISQKHKGLWQDPCSEPLESGEPQVTGWRHDARFSCSEPLESGEPQEPERGMAMEEPCREPLESGEPQARCNRGRIFESGQDLLQSRGDDLQSASDRRYKRGSYRWKQNRKAVARRRAKEARQRKEALHLWTTRLVCQASELSVVAPEIRDNTKSAKGNEKRWGAAVRPVAVLNRHVLAQAPAMAIQMLEYKAAEAGIPFARIIPSDHALAIGRELPTAAKAVRRLKRELKKEITDEAHQ